jgi:hypothetical protein
MNLFKAQAVRDYAAATAQIPVIDFGAVFAAEAGRARTPRPGNPSCL